MIDYPWLQTTWHRLLTQVESDQLPHALLLSGSAGVGKRELAKALGYYLQCSDRSELGACGECKSCLLHAAGNHPDFVECYLEDGAKQIKVDAIRQVSSFIVNKSQQGGYKVVIIAPAEAMNESSANALLKSLEEPGEKTVLILVSDSTNGILPTIRSRCQQVPLGAVNELEAVAWLKGRLDRPDQAERLLAIASGQPLTALALAQGEALQQRDQMLKELFELLDNRLDIVTASVRWSKFELLDSLDWLLSWMMDLARYSQTNNELRIEDSRHVFELMAVRLTPKQLHEQIMQLSQLRSAIKAGATPNKQLAIEGVLSRIVF
ncbi:DNA polymerase-3 subunit delta' [Sinobacterium caligoides]|uniref:DNA polymerase III subunit delta' n=1 Tax=Sinobacterium caligoides TaxID=933926 RepID=A0A3N2DL29_9GAMM|nr:DNA polymerase III subunit delta' [Sinobacterium caligoides]ROS00055.1 DNA polymerase-3 subunit delta' [Sinobacterium caligoides]